jgi:UDP-N-acetylglucosamine 2-epimerase (hydrolysing)
LNYVLIYPNNDKGADLIFSRIKHLRTNPKFRLFPSVRFEAFLVMLKNAQFIIGNSSAGIREAPYYGIPTINVGTRQQGRTRNDAIIHTAYNKKEILKGVEKALSTQVAPTTLFGTGNSNVLFLEKLLSAGFWKTPKQKMFADFETALNEPYA